jgi:hypothetical protein
MNACADPMDPSGSSSAHPSIFTDGNSYPVAHCSEEFSLPERIFRLERFKRSRGTVKYS